MKFIYSIVITIIQHHQRELLFIIYYFKSARNFSITLCRNIYLFEHRNHLSLIVKRKTAYYAFYYVICDIFLQTCSPTTQDLEMLHKQTSMCIF